MSTDLPPGPPPDASLLTRISLGFQALKKAGENPANPDYARLLHLSFDEDTYAKRAEMLRQTPRGRKLLEERKTVPGEGLSLEDLSNMPEGTLGHAFASYFEDNGIEPFSYEYPVLSDGEFLYKRYRETHDIHHILTGYGIDPLGEIELQAYYWSNLGLRHAAIISLVSLPYAIVQDGIGGLETYVKRIRAAFRRGKASPNILAIEFEGLWETPVSELSQRFCAPTEEAEAA